jgi:hypothetical protein
MEKILMKAGHTMGSNEDSEVAEEYGFLRKM